MKYRKFHEWELSELGLGCMRFPQTPEGVIDFPKAEEIICHAYNSGINYFDTAYRYHEGESELVIGKVLARFPRDTWHLVSKFPGHMLEKTDDGRLAFTGFPNRKVYFDDCKAMFETQLEKCGVDYFDIYLLHNVNERSLPFYMDESIGLVDYLLEEKKAGRIRHLGFSAHGTAETIQKVLDKYPGVFEIVQIQINYLDWTLQDAKAKYELLTKRNIPVISMESVRGGSLANLPEKAAAILKEADPTISQPEWALRYLQSLPNIQIVLSGMTTYEQLVENLKTFEEPQPLNEKKLAVLEKVVDTLSSRIPCTACRYCTEGCPMGIEIPVLIDKFNSLRGGASAASLNMQEIPEDKLPTACIGCGACAQVCPQNIDIPDVLKDFADRLG